MDKKEMKKAFKEQKMKIFKDSLPMKDLDFLPLFDFLENELDYVDCAGNLTLVERYCTKKNIDFQRLKTWFRENGGFCDCEILGNVEELFYYLAKDEIQEMRYEENETGKQTKLSSLVTDFGFSVTNIPSPWILKSICLNDTIHYEFRIGKKSDFKTSLEKDFPTEKLMGDSFLQEYWMIKTELDFDVEFVIKREKIFEFDLVQVSTKKYAPAFLFVYYSKLRWCLIMYTETIRLKNDRRALDSLLKEVSLLVN